MAKLEIASHPQNHRAPRPGYPILVDFAAKQELRRKLGLLSAITFSSRASIEPLKALLMRAEKERDEAKQAVDEGTRMFENLRKKSIEASTLLNGWENRDALACRLS